MPRHSRYRSVGRPIVSRRIRLGRRCLGQQRGSSLVNNEGTRRTRQSHHRGGHTVNRDVWDKNEALAWAIMKEHIEHVKAIVKDGVDINLRTGPEQTTALHLAARVGSCEIISYLTNAGASLEEKDADGYTPLHTAEYHEKPEAVELLCDLGADVNCRCDRGYTPLYGAAGNGNTEIIQSLFDRNIDIHCRQDKGTTPLSIASARGELQAVKLLVKLGADISLQNEEGDTAMHHAAEHNHATIVKYLIDLGADLNVTNDTGYNVLSIAALCKAQDVVKLIVQLEGVDVNQKDQTFAIMPLISATLAGSLEIAHLLVKNGAFVDATDPYGNTPLHYASVDHCEIVRFLLENGANIESRNGMQQTPFIMAANCHHTTRFVRLLAKRGADREAKDRDGFCALHYAVISEDNRLLRCLLKLGVDMEVRHPNGLTMLEYANATGKTSIASSLLEYGAKTTTPGKEKLDVPHQTPNDQLVSCAKHGNMTEVKKVLDHGVDINTLNSFGRSALSVAAEHGHNHLINLIIKRDGLIDLQDYHGETALWWASQCGHIEVVQRLLELGAQADLANSEGRSPLFVTCQGGHVDIVERLLEAGGDPKAKDNHGMTPWLLAVISHHVKVVRLLIGKGCVTLQEVGQIFEDEIEADDMANFMEHLSGCYGLHQTLNGPDVDINDANSADEYDDPRSGNQLSLAAFLGLIPEMLRLIKAGANINGPDRLAIPLIYATGQGQERAVQVLIDNGAQVDQADEDGRTALYIAAETGNKAIIDILCKNHANIEYKSNAWKITPLTLAAKGGHADVVEILLDRGAKPESSDSQMNALEAAVWNDSEDIIEILLSKGANARAVNQLGVTPLVCAIKAGKWNAARALLENGAGHDKVPGSSPSPMFGAVSSGHAAMVELLVKHGADINRIEDFDNTSPLVVAVELGKDMVVQSLIDLGADLTGKYDRGRTALSYAKKCGQRSIYRLLFQAQTLRHDDQYMKKAEEQRKIPKTSFKYQPLPTGSIRVIELQPGQKGNVVCFSLIQVELSKPLPFEALSYEWKGKVGTVPTRCDRERILVTPNCHAALEALRYKTRTRILWIDAICINQQDVSERSIQVSMMYEIYSTATSVLMWIGDEEDNSDLAFDSISAFSRAIEMAQLSEFILKPVNQNDVDLLLRIPDIRAFTEQLKRAPETWEAWAKLIRRSYFTRAWIFQEIILAGPRGKVICGTRQCSWDVFKVAIKGYRALKLDKNYCLNAIMTNDDCFRSGRYLRFDFALLAMSSFKAGNPHDKVFAALGLAFEGDSDSDSDWEAWQPVEVPKADYTKSVEEVFINANRYIIGKYGDRTLWRFLDPIDQSHAIGDTKSLPSWAFDFRKPLPPPLSGNIIPADHADYNMVSGNPITTQTSLHVNGYVVDTAICKVPITKEKSTVDIVKTVVQCIAGSGRGVYDPSPRIGKHGEQSGPEEDLGNKFWRTNLASLLNTLMLLRRCSEDEKMDFTAYVAWKLMADNETSGIFEAPPEILQDGIEDWEERSEVLADFDLTVCEDMETLHYCGYDLVYTEKGYFGLTLSREGDVGLNVTVIGGCPELVLLRKTQDGEGTWYEYVSKICMYGWTKDKIKTVEDLGDELKEVRFDIR